MKILIIPEITDPILMKDEIFRIEENLIKTRPTHSIANLMSWSIFTPVKKRSAMDYLVSGYEALSNSDQFKAFDIYIGFLNKEDFPRVDTIIFSTPMAKEIFEMRFKNILPSATETIIVTGDDTVENEVYKRTIIGNISSRN